MHAHLYKASNFGLDDYGTKGSPDAKEHRVESFAAFKK
jgi:hypothetical protein